ncbi:MAG TPA: hypothetical protein VFR73_21165 [Hyphomicrobiaceae bacterium]|nr:hypothetical protein [Hyphomicrobiaceae bacterium]
MFETDVTLHTIRHTVVTWLDELKVDSKRTAQFVGHADDRVTKGRLHARVSENAGGGRRAARRRVLRHYHEIQHLNGAQDAEIENSQPEKSKLDKSKDRGDAVARRPGRSLSA